MKANRINTVYTVHSIAASVLVLTAPISPAGSARWLLSPQDSAWENLSNWTAGGPPNGPSDTATFGPSSQRNVNVSTSVELNSIVFASNSDSFHFSVLGAELIISGAGIQQDSSVLQTFAASGNTGQIIFNNTSTAGHATIISSGDDFNGNGSGITIFNDSSTAESASLVANGGVYEYESGGIISNDTS